VRIVIGMRKVNATRLLRKVSAADIRLAAASAVLAYLLISLFFMNHYFFNTVINGVDVSLKPHNKADGAFISHVKGYRLVLLERGGKTETLTGQDMALSYNKHNSISEVQRLQFSFKWPVSLFKKQEHYVKDLYSFDNELLMNRINRLDCLNKDIVEPQNVSFRYLNGQYEVLEEVYGNKLHKGRLYEAIRQSVLKGQTELNLNESRCYIDPRYTLASERTALTRELLNKYVAAKITYDMRYERTVLDHSTINNWLAVDDNLAVIINEAAVRQYVKDLGKKYDTIGKARRFRASTFRVIEVKGGFYGWKINVEAETQALIRNIKRGDVLEREPIYAQKGVSRGENDIGNTYVEINLTKQYLWFYKNGKLIAQGPIVTGNPNRGYATEAGVYMLNYKQAGSILEGPDYEAEVSYWMPFNGNIGIHDASWRYSFGGSIYKSNGTHGCVNVPKHLAKRIYNAIEPGTPVICYEE
jgi:hypothetical protein